MSSNSPKLILGAGRKIGHYTTVPRSFDITIDRARVAGADHTLNLTRSRIPYPDGHFGEVHFEFFPYDQLIAHNAFALNEAARVTAAGGKLTIDTGRPLDPVQANQLRTLIRSVLENQNFAVTENPNVGHLQLEAVRGNV